MSLIRCLSNPEGLYIWHDITRKYWIASPGRLAVVAKIGDFNYIARAYANERKGRSKRGTCQYSYTEDYKIKLEVEGYEPIIMWEVTWAYICRSFEED